MIGSWLLKECLQEVGIFIGSFILYEISKKLTVKYLKPWIYAKPIRLWVAIKLGTSISKISSALHKKLTSVIWDDILDQIIQATLSELEITVDAPDKLRDSIKKRIGFDICPEAQKDIENTDD